MKINLSKSLLFGFQYLLAFLLLLDCRTIYGYLTITPSFWAKGKIFLTICVAVGCIIFQGNISSKSLNKALTASFGLAIYLFIYIILQPVERKRTIYFFLVVIVLLVYYLLVEENTAFPEVLCKYKNLIFIIAIVSLIIWFLGPILNIIRPTGYVWTTWTSNGKIKMVKHYYWLFFVTQADDSSILSNSLIVRNSAIFTEGPMASFAFPVAFLIEQLFPQKKDWLHYIIALVLIAAVISTTSVTGLCVLLLYYLIRFLQHKSNTPLGIIIRCIIVPVGVVIGGMVLYYLVNNKLDSKSGSYRLNDFVVCIQAWIKHPLFGCGIGNDEFISKLMPAWRGVSTGLANSIGQVLAQGGLYIFSLYIFCFAQSIYWSWKRKDNDKLTFTVIFLIIFTITIISYNYLTIAILFMLLEKHRHNQTVTSSSLLSYLRVKGVS